MVPLRIFIVFRRLGCSSSELEEVSMGVFLLLPAVVVIISREFSVYGDICNVKIS
jgi:hypothetical protein